jgi:dynein heavy chain, axonemal
MRATLKQLVKQAVKSYTTQPRYQWMLEQPAQLALAVSNVHWCQNVMAILSSVSASKQLQTFVNELADQLAMLADFASGKLTAVQRCIVTAIMTHDVHNRDVVAGLIKAGCSSVHDFSWQLQLRCAR